MQNETIDQFVERVTAYTEKATKGPWYLVEAPWRPHYYDKSREEHVVLPTYVVAGNPDPHGGKGVLNSFDIDDWPDDKTHDEWVRQSDIDLEFAAQSRTDLPAALVHIAALHARVAELEGVLVDARQWIGMHDTHGGHIVEALLSRLDRLAGANGGKG